MFSIVDDKLWGIFLSPGRKIRTVVKIHNEIVFIRLKLLKTGMHSESISLTLAELMLLPTNGILGS